MTDHKPVTRSRITERKNKRTSNKNSITPFILIIIASLSICLVLYLIRRQTNTNKTHTNSVVSKTDIQINENQIPTNNIVRIAESSTETPTVLSQFEIFYKKINQKIDNNYIITYQQLFNKISQTNGNIEDYFSKVISSNNDLNNYYSTNENNSNTIIKFIFNIISDSLRFLDLYVEDQENIYEEINYGQESLEDYINYLLVHILLNFTVKAFNKQFKEQESILLLKYNEKFKKDERMRKFAEQTYGMVQTINKELLEYKESNIFSKDCLQKGIKNNNEKVTVLLIKDSSNLRVFLELSFLNVIFYFFEFDYNKDKLIASKELKNYFKEINKNFTDNIESEENLKSIVNKCENIFNVLITIKGHNNINGEPVVVYRWNKEFTECRIEFLKILTDD